MRVSTTLLALGASTAISAMTCPPPSSDFATASKDIADWATDAINGFFPYQKNWEAAFDKAFSKRVKATFNETKYDFDSFKKMYKGTYPVLTAGFNGTFQHGFTSVIGVPRSTDRGGYVAVTGWEGGNVLGNPDLPINRTDAAYVVVSQEFNCDLKITEFREISNLASAQSGF